MVVVHDAISGPPAGPRHPEKAHRPDTPVLRKPDWIRVKAPVSRGYVETSEIVRAHSLHTVCAEAACPNIGECWEQKHATFMILGDTCTRACAFCNVKTGLPAAVDQDEPERVAAATAKLSLAHAVITSVDREFRRRHRGAAPAIAAHHHRGTDAGLPAQKRCARNRGCRQARHLQP